MGKLGMRARALGWVLLVSLFLGGCPRKEEKKENLPPRVKKVVIAPKKARVGDTLKANVSVFDREGDPLEIEIQWYVNDEEAEGEKGDSFDTAGLASGDEVMARARAVEKESGRASEWEESNRVVLGAPYGPKLKGVSIEPSPPVSYEPAVAVVDYGELDPAEVDVIYYRWFVNGTPLQGEEVSGPELSPEHFRVGDRIMVAVCTDGLFKQPHVWFSGEYKVINTPPTFTSEPEPVVNGKVVEIYLDAEDPDGDEIVFSVSGLPGAWVNQEKDMITVDASRLRPGDYSFRIIARDPYGGQAEYPFRLTIPE